MVKKIGVIIIVILVLLVVLGLTKDLIAKKVLSARVKSQTGLELQIKSMHLGLLESFAYINDLKVLNPLGYVDKVMMYIPEIYVDYDLTAFIKKKVRLGKLRLHLKELVVVKNEMGQLNLNSLKVIQGRKEEKAVQEEVKQKTRIPEFQIDLLQLKIDKVVYKDYSGGMPPEVREFNVNIDECYENITDPYSLGKLVVVKALRKTTIASLANFDLSPLIEGVANILEQTVTIPEKSVQKTLEVGKKVGKKAKDALKDTFETTTDVIKKILPFGE